MVKCVINIFVRAVILSPSFVILSETKDLRVKVFDTEEADKSYDFHG